MVWGRIILPFSSLVLRFLPFTHLPFAQQFSCMDELVHLPLEERGFLLWAAFYFCLHWGHVGGLRASLQVSPSQRVLSASTTSIFWSSYSYLRKRPLHLPPTPIPFCGWKGPLPCLLLPALLCFQAISGENGNILGRRRSFWGRALLSSEEKGSTCPLYPLGEGICEDMTSIKEGNPLYLWFLLQGQAQLTSCSFQEDLLLSSLRSQTQVGAKRKELQEWPLSPASFHWVGGDPSRAGGTHGSSSVPSAHLSCLLCLASWMLGLPGANWDTGDSHVTPVPFHTSPRLELEAAGRICQPRIIAPTSWSWLVPTIRFSHLVRTELCFPA